MTSPVKQVATGDGSLSGQRVSIPASRNSKPVSLNLRIFRVPSENRYKAEIRGQRVPINVTPDDLRVINESLAGAIARVSRAIGSDLKIDQTSAVELLEELAREGNHAFHAIFQDPVARMAIRQLIKTNVKMSIEIQSEDFFLPWELLYDGDPAVVRYENFWGFRYILSRCIVRDMTSRGVLFPFLHSVGAPALSLQCDESLTHVVSEEIPFFEGLAQKARIHLCKLRSLNPADGDHERKFFASHCRSTTVQVSHFACHGIYDDTQPHHSYLVLTDQFPLTIRDIRSLDFELAGYPLVFLNACETGLRNPLQTLDFVSLFLSIGARGVIVTEADVPDRFAAQFVRCFYQSFLGGDELGNCLLDSRRYFLNEYDNPLGLIYALYGEPSLHIRKISLADVIEET